MSAARLRTHMSGPLGQQVVAENRPGAGGIAGTDAVARSAPDGYTIVIMDPAIVINPTLQPSMPYDLFKQLATVSIVSSSPEVVVVAPQLPVKTIAELSPTARPIPASSISPPPASAPRRISPASSTSSAPASTPRMCPIAASDNPIRT